MSRIRGVSAAAKIPTLAMMILLAAPSLLAQTQQAAQPDPVEALNNALVAACKESEADFANYLTDENAAAFQKLPADERSGVMKRFVLLDTPGRPLLANDNQGHEILRCEASDASMEFRFGAARVHENLAYIPVTVTGQNAIQF